MTDHATQLAPPLAGRRPARRLAAIGLPLAALLVLLWWIDPSEVRVPLCGLYRTTGLHCPGCGATRATHELLHGRLLVALHYNALWVLSVPLVLYTLASQARRLAWGRPLSGDLSGNTRALIALVAIAFLFGVLRNLPIEPFTLLAPP